MTTDEIYQRYQGQSVSFDGIEANRGQCVQWADFVLTEAYDLPAHYGNAIDWWNNPGNLLDNFDKVSDGSVKKGDFVIFNTKVGSPFGHIDVAMQDGSYSGFQGADSNWGGNKTVHLVQHNNPSLILGVLRLKKEADMPNEGDVKNVVKDLTSNEATQQQVDVYTQKPWSAPDGLYYGYAQVEIARLRSLQPTGFVPVTEVLYKKA